MRVDDAESFVGKEVCSFFFLRSKKSFFFGKIRSKKSVLKVFATVKCQSVSAAFIQSLYIYQQRIYLPTFF